MKKIIVGVIAIAYSIMLVLSIDAMMNFGEKVKLCYDLRDAEVVRNAIGWPDDFDWSLDSDPTGNWLVSKISNELYDYNGGVVCWLETNALSDNAVEIIYRSFDNNTIYIESLGSTGIGQIAR